MNFYFLIYLNLFSFFVFIFSFFVFIFSFLCIVTAFGFSIFYFKILTKFIFAYIILMYDDFKIMSDNEYLNLAKAYEESRQMDSYARVGRLFNLLDACRGFCLLVDNRYNDKILKAVRRCKVAIDNCFANLSTLFKIEKKEDGEFKQFGLFCFLTKLQEICELLLRLFEEDNKVYNKKICLACVYSLNDGIRELLLSLENSNIKIFKFM